MTRDRIQQLRRELDGERISYGELVEIEAAFAVIPDEELPEARENAMPSDMLDELEKRTNEPD